MTTRPRLLLLVSVLGGAGSGRAQDSPAEEVLARAIAAHRAGDAAAAIAHYESYLQQRPDNVEARSNLGAAYAGLGRYERAIQEYRRALARRDDPAVRLNLALAHYKAAQLAEASAQLTRVLAARPGHRNASLLLADCHLRLGRHQQAVELLTPLEAEAGDDKALAYLLGMALLGADRVDQAQPRIDRILRDGETAEAHLLLGVAHQLVNDLPGAVRELARAVELNPRLPSVHSFYGRALLQTGSRDAAAEAFRAELAQNPNDFESHLYLGVLLKQEHQVARAMEHLQKALWLRPGAPEVRYQIASLHLAEGRTVEARPLLEALVAEFPEFQEAHVSLATLYYRLKRKADGDRHRAIVEELARKAQAVNLAGREGAAGSYRGEVAPADGRPPRPDPSPSPSPR